MLGNFIYFALNSKKSMKSVKQNCIIYSPNHVVDAWHSLINRHVSISVAWSMVLRFLIYMTLLIIFKIKIFF